MATRPASATLIDRRPLSVSLDRGGFSISDRDGMLRTYEMPARLFLEGVAAMAQQLPRNLPPTHVVQLYLKAMGNLNRPPGYLEDRDK
jgi:hypothetical protein